VDASREAAQSVISWNAPECARDGHEMGTRAFLARVPRSATAWKEWWAGRGLNRRHQDFQA